MNTRTKFRSVVDAFSRVLVKARLGGAAPKRLSMGVRATTLGIVAGLALALGGCMREVSSAPVVNEPRSIIASIGNSGIITFDKNAFTPMDRELVGQDEVESGELAIPITIVQSLQGDVQKLLQQAKQNAEPNAEPNAGANAENGASDTNDKGQFVLTSTVTVSLYGVSPPAQNEYRLRLRNPADGNVAIRLRDENSDVIRARAGSGERWLELPAAVIDGQTSSVRTSMIELVLRPQYVARLESMDQLKIQVQVQDVYESVNNLKTRKESLSEYDDAEAALATFLRQQFESSRKLTQSKDVKSSEASIDPVPRDVPPDSKMPKWVSNSAEWEKLQKSLKEKKKKYVAAANALTTNRMRSSNAVRMLTLMSSADYRQRRLKNMVPIYNVNAFPLSSVQTEYLFGKKVDRTYYVVGLSIQNTSEDDKDKYVNSGMIRVSGQALIRPQGAQADTWFTVPVSVSPQTREHVYTVLDDEEVEEPRSIFFRALEFGGTLATAIVTGFNGSEEAIRGLGIATGIGIPEGKKFWADRWPGYKRNVVNYAMPNLIKIGKGTSSPTYFLFFSKTRLEGMVLDSQLFNGTSDFWRSGLLLQRHDESVESSPVNVATLSFDSIEIPFEYAADPKLLEGSTIPVNAVMRAAVDASSDAASRVTVAEQRVAKAQALMDAMGRIRVSAKSIADKASTSLGDLQSMSLPGDAGDDAAASRMRATAQLEEAIKKLNGLSVVVPREVTGMYKQAREAMQAASQAAYSWSDNARDHWSAHDPDSHVQERSEASKQMNQFANSVRLLARELETPEWLADVRALSVSPVKPEDELESAKLELEAAKKAAEKANAALRVLTPPKPTPVPNPPVQNPDGTDE